MTNTISISEWIRAIDQEYLSSFISDGGATVKFAITAEEKRNELKSSLRSIGLQNNYQLCTIDASECRVYMPQDIFFALAKQVDWRLLARKVILRLLEDLDYRTSSVDPNQTETGIVQQVANINGLERNSVIHELRPNLQNHVFKNSNMVRAFRIAMSHLCLIEQNSMPSDDYRGQPLIDWLTGDNLRIGNVREFNINTIINRTTARYLIDSALYWIRFAGYPGTILVIDNSRVSILRNPRDGKRYYTKAMTMDHYELLREFIDDVSRLNGLFLVVASDYNFIDDDSLRGWGIYSALRTRVMDDVRDRNVVNPVSALIRLS